jgi:hypothetical protein
VAIVKKDLKGMTRRRELSSLLLIPAIFTIIFIFESFTSTTGGLQQAGSGFVEQFPVFLVAGLFSLIISSTSFGQESKSVMVLYSVPVSPEEILRAKAFVALALSLTATLVVLAVFSVLGGATPWTVAENLAIAVAITFEDVFVGLAFGVRFPDFQERPRPRFMDPVWLMVMTLVGMGLALVTAAPAELAGVASTVPGLAVPFYLLPAGVAFAAVVTILSYRFARSSVRTLMAEYRI